MNWDDLRFVLALARAGTLAGAARRLGVNQTTVARRLSATETVLGARLFERIGGTLRPTPAGEAAIAHAADVEEDVKALEDGVGNEDSAPAGQVRLTAVPVLVNRLIIPALPRFRATYPRIRLDLIALSRNVSLARHEADIALRLARPEQGGSALTRRIGHLDYATYGPRGHEAERLPWIGYDASLAHLPHARFVLAEAEGGAASAFTVNNAEACLQAVAAGLGKSLLPCFAAAQEKRLARIGPDSVVTREVWLLAHRELRHHRRIDAVITWLEELFAALASGGPA
ncbi:MAG TPA: LysR family transcriptional regulator [Acetobacteraceae bacterium]|nr:LysR family transcriptional regulator [Acetobacteraceae bacterium]